MKPQRWIAFSFHSVTGVLAVGFFLLVWRPELFSLVQPVVYVQEAPAISVRPAAAANSYAEAVDAAAPAVISINTSRNLPERRGRDRAPHPFFGEPFGPSPRSPDANLGSGVLISPQGYALTNHHVIEGADEIQVTLKDGRESRATVVGIDPDSDLAVLKIDLPDLPTVVLGDADALREGDVVLAIGNPFGVGQTVTQGIVSATGRKQLGLNTFENFIQTDAAINPGNSGGALINTYGELVGINTAIFTRTGGSQGIGFAIPVNLARTVMQQLIETGSVSRGWLGVEIQNLTPQLAESFGLSSADGVIIAGILKDGPAEQAGLTPGDVIIRIDGRPVAGVTGALDMIAGIVPGTRIRVTGKRNGRDFEVEATVRRRPTQHNR